MKHELRGKIMTECAALRQKTCSYLTNDNNETKKPENTKKFVIKWQLKFENYKHCLEATQLENKISELEKIELKQIVIEKIIKNS